MDPPSLVGKGTRRYCNPKKIHSPATTLTEPPQKLNRTHPRRGGVDFDYAGAHLDRHVAGSRGTPLQDQPRPSNARRVGVLQAETSPAGGQVGRGRAEERRLVPRRSHPDSFRGERPVQSHLRKVGLGSAAASFLCFVLDARMSERKEGPSGRITRGFLIEKRAVWTDGCVSFTVEQVDVDVDIWVGSSVLGGGGLSTWICG